VAQHLRSGKPQHFDVTATAVATVQEWSITVGPTNHLIINNNHASTVLRVYLTEDAMDADEGFDINPGYGHEFPVEVLRFWTLTAAAGSFQAVAISRP
jgi:hypothetical protein